MDAFENELRAQLQQGNKIQAIKLYRERNGVGLREAKEAVEAMQRGEIPVAASLQAPLVGGLEGELLALLQQGRKLEAVKLYKDRTGKSLVDSKNAVEALQRGEPVSAVSAPQHDALTVEILPSLRMGEWREAIRLYQKRTGAKPAEAKRAVAAIARRHDLYDRESALLRTLLFACLGVGILVLGIVASIFAFANSPRV